MAVIKHQFVFGSLLLLMLLGLIVTFIEWLVKSYIIYVSCPNVRLIGCLAADAFGRVILILSFPIIYLVSGLYIVYYLFGFCLVGQLFLTSYLLKTFENISFSRALFATIIGTVITMGVFPYVLQKLGGITG